MNFRNPQQKKAAIFSLLMLSIIGFFVVVFANNKDLKVFRNKSSVAGVSSLPSGSSGGGGDACEVLGLETGIIASQPQGVDQYYFQKSLGVVTTVAAINDSIDEIVSEATASPAEEIHGIRIAYFERAGDTSLNGLANQTAKLIAEIRRKSSDKIHIMPANEPRTELGGVFGEEAVPGGRQGGEWLRKIIDQLKNSGDSRVADTKSYLMFPAFNFHVPQTPGTYEYINAFFDAYGGNPQDDFVSLGVSLQHQPDTVGPMADRIAEYRQLIEGRGISNYKISLYAAAVVNGVAGQDYVDAMSALLEQHLDILDGVHIFTPWGWDYDPTGLIRNEPIPHDIWDKLFESCSQIGDQTLSCEMPYIDKYPGLQSCETKNLTTEPGPCTSNNGLCAGVSMKKEVVNGKEIWFANPIITTEVTNFSLLNWMTNSSYFDSEREPYAGTSSNPYLAPCAIDKQTAFGVGDIYPDFSKVFAGTLKYIDGSGNFNYNESLRRTTYSMPLLGNAIACMIWRHNNFQPGSEDPLVLEPRFATPVKPESPPVSFEEASARLKQTLKSGDRDLEDNKSYCGGTVNRIEKTDSVSGPEIIEYENGARLDYTYDRSNICRAIAGGIIDVGGTANAVYLCPPELTPEQQARYRSHPNDPEILAILREPNPNAYLGESKDPGEPYLRVSWPSTDALEIVGGGEALAELWKEEAELFPLQGSFHILHRDKAGIQITMKRTLYDGNKGKGENYMSPLATDSPECVMNEYVGSSYPIAPNRSFDPNTGTMSVTGQGEGAAEYTIPWIGQSVHMSKRMSLVYTEMKNGNYIENMHNTIKDFTDKFAVETDDHYLERSLEELPDILSYPTNLFMCADLDKISKSLKAINYTGDAANNRDSLVEFINFTDCIASKSHIDPFQQWLCQSNYLEGIYCTNILQCIPFGEDSGSDGTPVSPIELAAGTLIYPVPNRVTQNYIPGAHPGIDWGVSVGTPVRATADGTVYYFNVNGDERGTSNGLYAGSGLMEQALGSGNYGGLIVIDHGSFHSLYAHLSDKVDLTPGQTIKQGTVIGYTGNTGNSSGPHLHFEIRREGCYRYYDENCTVNPLRYLGEGQFTSGKTGAPSSTQDPECITLDGRPGYYVDSSGVSSQISRDQADGKEYQNLSPDELESKLLNACPVNIPYCDTGCRDRIKDWVQKLADRNISAMGSKYSTNTHYSKDQIDLFMDKMWNESPDTDTPFQWLIAIWLAENGLNPVHKNQRTDIKSDVFGCGVFCVPPPQNFDEELACVLRRLPGCSFLYSFDQRKPGSYLQPYGPIQTNRTFSTKVFLVWDRLAEIQGISGARDTSVPGCNLYVYDENSGEMADLQWAIDLLNSTK